jgi:acyl carrier protein
MENKQMNNQLFEEVIAFVAEFTATNRKEITRETKIEEDLGVTGDDGDDLLKAVEKRFNIVLFDPEYGCRKIFGLNDNEYLFGDEGFAIDFGLFRMLFRWLQKKPPIVIRDLTINELCEVIIREQANQHNSTS